MEGTPQRMALLMYGGGLRILECARLRIKDVDFDRQVLTLQDTKGGQGRVTMLPEAAREPLREQIRYARELYHLDPFLPMNLPPRVDLAPPTNPASPALGPLPSA